MMNGININEKGHSSEAHYHQGTFSKVLEEISQRFDDSKNTYLIAVETRTFTKTIFLSPSNRVEMSYWSQFMTKAVSGAVFFGFRKDKE